VTEEYGVSASEVTDAAGTRAGQRAPAAARPQWRARSHSAARLGAPALTYLVVRGIGVAILWVLSRANGKTLTHALTSWDAKWYLGIAAGGYSRVPAGLTNGHGGRTPETPLAFFPGYPATVWGFAALPGVSLVAAGLAVSLAAGVLGSYALAGIGESVRGGSRRAGLLLVALFAASPIGVALSMAYSEALFCALAAACLLALLRRNWLLAGLCCALAGLVRITGAALVLAVCLAAAVAIVRRRDSSRPWVGGLLAPLGLVGYLAWVGYRTGSVLGYFHLQARGWDDRFDGGVATARFVVEQLTAPGQLLQVATVACLAAAIILLVLCAWRRVEWPLVVYALAVVVLGVGSNGLMNAKIRLLLPAFVLLLPPAIGLARRRPVTALAVVAGAALVSGWFGAYALTVWPYAI
jgi:uncharacterized integral membrane protein